MHTAQTAHQAMQDFQRFHADIWEALGCDSSYAVEAGADGADGSCFEVDTGISDLRVTVTHSPSEVCGVATVEVRVGAESVLTYGVPVAPHSGRQFVQRLLDVLSTARPWAITPPAAPARMPVAASSPSVRRVSREIPSTHP